MIKMSNYCAIIKREILCFVLNPSTYISCLFFLATVTINYFFTNQFFVLNVGSTDLRFFFEFMPIISVLVIPSLTMGLWRSEDLESTLPITSIMLVTAKWLASLVIYYIVVLLSLALPLAVSFFGYVEIPVIISSVLGVFLFAASLCAFGQLCTIIFSSQAASYFMTALLLAVFTFNGYIANSTFFENNILKTVIRFFSFAWHFDPFSKGIIDTRGMFFFICTAVLYLLCSVVILEMRKYGPKSILIAKKRILYFSISAVILTSMVLWNSQVYYKRFDITTNNRFSLSQYSKNIIKTLDSPLTISYYITDDLQEIYPNTRDIEDFLNEYASESSNIRVKIFNPNTDYLKDSLQALGVEQQSIPSLEQNRASIVQAYSAIVFEYKNATEVIPFIINTSTLEFDIAGRLQALTDTLHRSAFILVGNGLTLQHDYPLVAPVLENSGFTVRELQLDEILQVSTLDTKTPLVVLGSSKLSVEHANAIRVFIEVGGRVFFAVSPIDIDLNTWQAKYIPNSSDGIISMLQDYGIVIEPALVHDVFNMETQLLAQDGTTIQVNYPLFINVPAEQSNQNVLLGQAFRGVSLLWASPTILDVDNTETEGIIYSSKSSWLQTPNNVLYNQGESAFITNPLFEPNLHAENELQKMYTIAATHDDSIVVVSDQYFLSRALSYINQSQAFMNFDFLVNALLWLHNDYDVIALKSNSYFDYSFSKITDEEGISRAHFYSVFFLSIWYLCASITPFILVRVTRKHNKNKYMKSN